MDPVVLVLIVLALVMGGLGYWLGQRPVADWRDRHARRDTEARELDEKFRKAVIDLENATVRAERVDGLATQIEVIREERDTARNRLATMEADAANHEKQIILMKEAREELLTQFRAAGSEVLSKAQEKFIADAAERFGNSERANKEAVANLLKPVNERLEKYEQHVGALEAQRSDAFSKLHQQLSLIHI